MNKGMRSMKKGMKVKRCY